MGTTAALATSLALPVPAPTAVRVSIPVAALAGLLAGAAVFSLIAGRPRLRALPTPTQAGFLVGWSWVEEVLWRRLLLSGLAVVAGAAVALVATTTLFALAHSDRGVHLLTGALFGSLFLATGRLAAAVTAHAAYNLLVAAARDPA